MPTTEATMSVPPERVFAVLADPASYGEWVVGAKEIRGTTGRWPEVGSKIHHSMGAGPLVLRDHTEVLVSEPPRRLVLRAKVRPIGELIVELELEPEGEGTRVVMREVGSRGLTTRIATLVAAPLVRGRNRASLARLQELAERGG